MLKKNSAKQRVNFRLHAPAAREVFVAGSFNDWDPQARPLKCDKQGTWKTWMRLAPGAYEYRFIVNGKWQEDPSCKERHRNAFGTFNSVLQI